MRGDLRIVTAWGDFGSPTEARGIPRGLKLASVLVDSKYFRQIPLLNLRISYPAPRQIWANWAPTEIHGISRGIYSIIAPMACIFPGNAILNFRTP